MIIDDYGWYNRVIMIRIGWLDYIGDDDWTRDNNIYDYNGDIRLIEYRLDYESW